MPRVKVVYCFYGFCPLAYCYFQLDHFVNVTSNIVCDFENCTNTFDYRFKSIYHNDNPMTTSLFQKKNNKRNKSTSRLLQKSFLCCLIFELGNFPANPDLLGRSGTRAYAIQFIHLHLCCPIFLHVQFTNNNEYFATMHSQTLLSFEIMNHICS